MKPEDKKILDMLRADDPEMVKLGAIMALGMGQEWLLDNITITGNKILDCSLTNTIITNGKLALVFGNKYVIAEYDNRWKKTLKILGVTKDFKIIDI